MLLFPKTTEFNRRIPKQKFYNHLSVSPQIKKIFVEQIAAINWTNKLAPTTLNVKSGERVTEIEVFHLLLNQKGLDERVLQLIDKEIPYHILFELEYEGQIQVWIGYKEESQTRAETFKVNRYYQTDWMTKDEIHFEIAGLNMDALYDGLIKQAAGDSLRIEANESVGVAIQRTEEKEKLEKQILALEKKLYKEKQFNRQVQLNTELKILHKQMEELISG
ncbi:MAG: DUF4391 domain-containing protein [Trichococcus flocculiformis]